MKGCHKLILCFASIIFFIGCKKQEAAPDSEKEKEIYYRLINLQNYGWKSMSHTQNIDGINFTAVEVPIQYYLLKDKGEEALLEIDSIYQANKTERVMEFTFLHEEEKDLLGEEFTRRNYDAAVKYMSFGLQDDFYAVTSKHDTIACQGATFERTFKVGPYNRVLLFFSGVPSDEKLQLVYNDSLFGKGTIKFNFREKIIKL